MIETPSQSLHASLDEPARRVWVISDGAAGNERQALALAAAMGLTAHVIRLHLRAPWRWFAPRFTFASRWAFARGLRRQLQAPWPALAIGCGRHAALLTRNLRTWSAGKTYCVQILDPRIDPAHFDVVIAPRHDQVTAPNAIATLGALNSIDDAWLAQARGHFPILGQLPQPRTVLLVGGPRRGLNLDEAWFDNLIALLERWREHEGGSLLIATSRRTPALWKQRLRSTLRNGCTCFWGGADDGANPFAGYLGVADRIVVTPDSVNMLSEACATGVPVISHLPDKAPQKLSAFHRELRDQRWLVDENVDLSTIQQPMPLREIASIASKLWQRIESTRADINVALDQAKSSPADAHTSRTQSA